MSKVLDHESLQKIIANTANLDSLARLGTGSKTNDKIIRASVRDLSSLIRFAKRNVNKPVITVVKDAADILVDVTNHFKQLNLFQ